MARKTLKQREAKTAKKPKPTREDALQYIHDAPRRGGRTRYLPESKPIDCSPHNRDPQYRKNDRMLSVRLPAELLDALDKLAARRRETHAEPYSKTQIVALAIEDYLVKADRRLKRGKAGR